MKPTLADVFDMLQEVEEMAFYVMSQEPDKYKKGHRKVVDEKIREALKEAHNVLQKEAEQ